MGLLSRNLISDEMTVPPPPDPFFTFRPHCGEITSLKYLKLSDSESGIASGTSSGIIHLWSLISKRSLWRESADGPILKIDTCCIGGETRLICQTRNNTVAVWDYMVQKRLSSVRISDPGFCKITTISDGKCTHFASPSQELGTKVNIHDMSSGKIEKSYTTKEEKPQGMCMCVNSLRSKSSGILYILGGYEDGALVMWDERNPRTELHTCQLFSAPVLCMTVDNAGSGAAGSVSTAIQFLRVSLDKGTLEKSFETQIKNPGLSDIDVRCDQKLLATGGWDGRIRLFTWMKGSSLAIINYHSRPINCITFAGSTTFHNDRNLLLCGSKDEVISVWKLY